MQLARSEEQLDLVKSGSSNMNALTKLVDTLQRINDIFSNHTNLSASYCHSLNMQQHTHLNLIFLKFS